MKLIKKSEVKKLLRNYPYGRVHKRLERALNWLATNDYVATAEDAEDEIFDYPEYGGLPKRISNQLSGDEVDYIQSIQFDVRSHIVRK